MREESLTTLVGDGDDDYVSSLISRLNWDGVGAKPVAAISDYRNLQDAISEHGPEVLILGVERPSWDPIPILKDIPGRIILVSSADDFLYADASASPNVYRIFSKPVKNAELEKCLKDLVLELREQKELEEQEERIIDDVIPLMASSENPVVNKAIEYTSSHYMELMGLREASECCGVTESHLSRTFRECTGMNYLQYLNAVRINMASKLLVEEDLQIADIAHRCGFPTAGYFSKMFRKFSGMTPKEYRESMRASLNR